jgi:hypothetical protein
MHVLLPGENLQSAAQFDPKSDVAATLARAFVFTLGPLSSKVSTLLNVFS